jgi:hypothetical protein
MLIIRSILRLFGQMQHSAKRHICRVTIVASLQAEPSSLTNHSAQSRLCANNHLSCCCAELCCTGAETKASNKKPSSRHKRQHGVWYPIPAAQSLPFSQGCNCIMQISRSGALCHQSITEDSLSYMLERVTPTGLEPPSSSLLLITPAPPDQRRIF